MREPVENGADTLRQWIRDAWKQIRPFSTGLLERERNADAVDADFVKNLAGGQVAWGVGPDASSSWFGAAKAGVATIEWSLRASRAAGAVCRAEPVRIWRGSVP
jgi:hypothetical protein